MGREREDSIDLTSSPEPKQIKTEGGAASNTKAEREPVTEPVHLPRNAAVKQDWNASPEPTDTRGKVAQSVNRTLDATTSQMEKRPAPEDDSDEDLELELRKTDLELKKIELQQKLRRKRKAV